MKFNFTKLLGRMKEYGYTQEQLAKAIGISEATLNLKLKNKSRFRSDEMLAICKVLSIPTSEINEYFFAV